MRPLVINEAVRQDVADLIERAKTWRFDFPTLKKIAAGVLPAPGDDSRFVCHIPIGYRCVFTHEMQPHAGWCRHLSVSVSGSDNSPGPIPGVDPVHEISKLFGFKNGMFSADHMYREELPDGGVAVNFIQKVIEGDTT